MSAEKRLYEHRGACTQCGSPFSYWRQRERLSEQNKTTVCPECRVVAIRRAARKRRKPVAEACVVCGAEWTLLKARDRGSRRACSTECAKVLIERAAAARRKGPWKKTCPGCEKTYVTNWRPQKFCSQRCAVQHRKRDDAGERPPVVPVRRAEVRRRLEEEARKRDLDRACSGCGQRMPAGGPPGALCLGCASRLLRRRDVGQARSK